jgi:uroporphyrin-III C-methyltransferase
VLALVLVAGALVAAYQYTRQTTVDLASVNRRLSESLQQQQQLQQQLTAANAAVAEQTKRLNNQQNEAQKQQQELAEARKSFDAQEQLLDSERQKMHQREAELRASVADVHKRVGASGTQWMVAEAEYLLRLANQRLNLTRDVGTARSALILADHRLADTGDPGWNAVRHQIAREIAALDATDLPDVAGLSAKLNALAEEVPQLHLAHSTLGGPPPTPEAPAHKKTDTPKARTWDNLLAELWTGFKDTVRIRRNNQPVQAMLAPDQQFFLYENLRLQLETARLGLARGDAELYRDSLNTVNNSLGSYFDPSSALTQSMRKQVSSLIGIDIHPPLPDISQSLRNLEARRKLNQDLARNLPGSGGATQ